MSSVLAFYFFSENKSDPYFATLGGSYVSLFVLMTTANFPDVMMPSYANNEFACLFFVVYVCPPLPY
jgi:two pore calcium channel protein 1